MTQFHVEIFSARERRSAAIIVTALMLLGLAVGAYLRPPPGAGSELPPTPSIAVAAWDFISPTQGWVLIDDQRLPQNRVFSTADSGRSWRQGGRLPDGTVSRLHFYDRRTGVAEVLEDSASGRPHALTTMDGGMTWGPPGAPETGPEPAPLDRWPAVFFDARSGIRELAKPGGVRTLSLTLDGGLHWRPIPLPAPR